MSKLRCPDCKSTHLAQIGEDELECTKCGFSGYSRDFEVEEKIAEKIFNPSLRMR